jgi:hypothetical protein
MTERAKSADEYLWQEHKLFSFEKKKRFFFFIFLLLSTVCPGTGQKGSQKPPKKRFSHGWAEPRLPQLNSTGHTHPHLILILSDLILKHLSPQLISFGLWQREREKQT